MPDGGLKSAVVSQPAAAEDMTGEKRSLTRRRQLKSGMIFYNLRSFTLPCTVRDISETGARLRVDGTLVAPDTFELNIELDGLWADCEVVWRRGNEIGVHFASPPKINAPKRRQSLQAYIEPHKGHLLRRHDKG